MSPLLHRTRTIAITFAVAALSVLFWSTTTTVQKASAQSIDWPGFAYYHEFYGPTGYSDPSLRQNLNLYMTNGITFSPPAISELPRLTRPFNAGLMLRMSGAPGPSGLTAAVLDQHRSAFEEVAASTTPDKALWLLMPEWDQSGGAWVASGRPKYYGLSRASAHDRFLTYYRNTYPTLLSWLAQPLSQRNHLLTAVTVYAPSVYDAYELGVDVQMLERGLDELGDHSTGIPFLRGAAKQYNRIWGVDISTWRTSTNSATNFNDNGSLIGGWSPSYLRRLTYASYLSGANLVLNEASTYRFPNGNLNPFGAMTQEFADFALFRHKDVGRPVVDTALLISPDAGYEPKHGIYNQSAAVWYRDIPFSAGDSMTDQFFRFAFPNHWLHGLTPGAPFANAAGVPNTTQFRSYLASGQDPRPYEPMPFTRWGDRFDVINSRISASALANYRTIILMGDVTLTPPLRSALNAWVAAGGTLVLNSAQVVAEDQVLSGATIDAAAVRTARFSRWSGNDPGRAEAAFSYPLVQAKGAQVLAMADNGDPLLTRNSIGAGEVYLSAPSYFMPTTRDNLLALGVQFYDFLMDRNAPAQVSGPPLAYIINKSGSKTIAALFNHTASEWNGQLSLTAAAAPSQVTEYISDRSVAFSYSANRLTVPVSVPPFDLKIVAIDLANRDQTAIDGEPNSTDLQNNHAKRSNTRHE
jgi:hypothetical protein